MSAIRDIFGDVTPKTGRITLELPPLAESGNSVPLRVSIDSPMTKADHVRRVCIFANRNPRPLIATVIFAPQAGKAAFSTTLRLSGTQDVIAMAELSDGTIWTEQAPVMVTVGACDTLQSRY
jgi:sulfur-oxidizing protein SoxY